MSRIWLGILLVMFGALFLLNSLDLIKPGFGMEYLNLIQKYWPGLLIILGFRIILKDKYPVPAEALKWLLILLISLWFFCMFFIERNWII